jgi:septum formation protein
LLVALIPQFMVAVSNIPEPMTGDAVADAVALARAKAQEVAARTEHAGAIVIGADTIVHDGQRAYGKPADTGEAIAMLAALRGRTHQVVTGLALVTPMGHLSAHSLSHVTMTALSDGQARAYIDTGRPLDKAGAYAIQDDDVPTVARLVGCYCGVMGLPLWKLRALLGACGVDCLMPDATYPRCSQCPERPGSGKK